MLWAQIMPFVALGIIEGGGKGGVTVLLLSSFGVWLCLNIVFFLSIERDYVRTFFTTTTGPEYTVQLFREAPSDELRFDAAFTNRRSYINGLEEEVKEWLRENIDRFNLEQPEWWKIDMVLDEFLPAQAIEAEGGVRRRRSSVHSVRELFFVNENE